MVSFFEYARNLGIKVPEKDIPAGWFFEHGCPMVVSCSCCGMTMAMPAAFIDEDGNTYCVDCAEE